MVRLVVPGQQGVRGFSVFSGADAPSNDFGFDGDFYLRLPLQTLYAKAFGAWGAPIELRGLAILSGAGAPSNGTGRDGEFYLRLDNWTLSGPKAGGVWPAGIELRGFSVLSGSGVPDPGTGRNGEFYIRTSNWTIYGPKAGGDWGAATSLVGPQGPQGFSVLSGSGVPDPGLGVNGDFYIRTGVWTIQGPKAGGNWGAATSLVGTQGVAGLSVRSGSAVPDPGLGVDGEFYIRTGVWTIYGPKTGGAWGAATSLVGPTGTVVNLDAIPDVDTSTVPAQVGSQLQFNGTLWVPTFDQRGGLRNFLINGSFAYNQRLLYAVSPAFNTGAYVSDRWAAQSVGASLTAQTRLIDQESSLRIFGAAGCTSAHVLQRIESHDAIRLRNQNVTISVSTANSSLTSVQWEAWRPAGTDNFVSRLLIASGTWTVSPTMSRYAATFNAGNECWTGLEIRFTVGAQLAGTTWDLMNAQLELGNVATPFERVPTPLNQAMCKRFYQWVPYNHRYSSAGNGAIYAHAIYWPEMRTIPTVGALVIDPYTSALSSAFNTGGLVVLTPYSGHSQFIASNVGDAFIYGYRWPLSAEL